MLSVLSLSLCNGYLISGAGVRGSKPVLAFYFSGGGRTPAPSLTSTKETKTMQKELLTEAEYFTSWLAFMAVSTVSCGLAGAFCGALGFPAGFIVLSVMPVSYFCWRILVQKLIVERVASRK